LKGWEDSAFQQEVVASGSLILSPEGVFVPDELLPLVSAV
jgi:hypothetical protein